MKVQSACGVPVAGSASSQKLIVNGHTQELMHLLTLFTSSYGIHKDVYAFIMAALQGKQVEKPAHQH